MRTTTKKLKAFQANYLKLTVRLNVKYLIYFEYFK